MNQKKLSWFTWKRLIIALIIIGILLLSIYFYSMFRSINASKVDGFDQTESYLLQETDMIKIDKMYMYQDEILYHIAYARDKDNEEWIVFVPILDETVKDTEEDDEDEDTESSDKDEKNEKDMIIIEAAKMMSQKDIESVWAQECSECELKGSSPALIDDTPLWELTYIDNQNRYVMEYRKLKNAETYEQLKLNRKYNKKG